MKQLILVFIISLLTGCSFFTNSTEESSLTENSSTAELDTDTTYPPNETYDNVFNEVVIGENRYPSTSLPDTIPIGALREAIETYYVEVIPAEDKENNLERVDSETLQNLQRSLSENKQLNKFNATVDQIQIDLGGNTNYVTRIVINMTLEEAATIHNDNDILLLNEALTHIGNRLVLVAYYDDEAETLLPYHLNNSSYSLFSLGE